MRFLTLDGKWIDFKIKKIDWNAPCLSKFQFRVKKFIEPFWKDSPFVSEEFVLPKTALRVDLINFGKKLAIECDGAQHGKYCPGFFHESHEDFIDQLTRDEVKEKILEKNKFKLIRVYEDTVLTKENFESIFGAGIL